MFDGWGIGSQINTRQVMGGFLYPQWVWFPHVSYTRMWPVQCSTYREFTKRPGLVCQTAQCYFHQHTQWQRDGWSRAVSSSSSPHTFWDGFTAQLLPQHQILLQFCELFFVVTVMTTLMGSCPSKRYPQFKSESYGNSSNPHFRYSAEVMTDQIHSSTDRNFCILWSFLLTIEEEIVHRQQQRSCLIQNNQIQVIKENCEP